jgi:hypothetical protein
VNKVKDSKPFNRIHNTLNLSKEDNLGKEANIDERETQERISTLVNTSFSNQPEKKEKSKKSTIEEFLEDYEDVNHSLNTRSRRLTYDLTTMPKQICNSCGTVNLYFEVECSECKKFL